MRIRSLWYIILVTLAAVGASAGENLLVNGDFEQGERGAAGWSFAVWSSKPSRASFEWSTDAHSGDRAVRLTGVENAGEERVRCLLLAAPVDVQEGLYTLKGWHKTGGDSAARIQLDVYAEEFAGGGTPTQENIHRRLDQAADWESFDFDINIKRGAMQVVILLRATGIGDVYYDDVSFEQVTDPLSVRLYPAEYGRRNTLPLVRGAPNFARLMLSGERDGIGGDAEIVLDLPPGVGTFGLLDPGEPVERDGVAYTRLRVPVDDDTLAGLKKGVSHCSVTVWLDATDMPEHGSIFYRAVVDGEERSEKQAAVRVLPPLPSGPRPERFHGFICWGLFGEVPEKLRPAVYDMVRGMGVDTHLAREEPAGWGEYLQRRVRADGGRLWANVPYAYLKAMREAGWETRIIADPDSFFALDDGYYERMAPDVNGVFWDWEPANAMRNPLWDHAPTVAAFAEREGLDPERLTEDHLKGELRDRFLAFRTWQLSEVVRLWAAYVHDLRPDLTIAMCQGSGMPPERHVDYRAYDDIARLVHLPMIYTSGAMSFAQNVADLRQYLPESDIFPMTSSGMVADAGWLASKSPRAIYFDYVCSALLGCVGCSHWPNLNRGYDMEYVWEITRAMRDVGTVEGFLLDGQADPETVSVTPLPESEARIKTARGEVKLVAPEWGKFAMCHAHRLNRETLVSVCNMHPERPATVQVRIADAQGDGWLLYDPVSRAALAAEGGESWRASDLARGVLYEVPASALGMLVASTSAPKGGFTEQVRESDVRDRFEARRAKAAAAGDISVLHEGNLEISWEDMDGDGGAEVRMASGRQQLGIGPSGNLWSWKVQGHAQDLVSRFDEGGACVDQFWWPEGARAAREGRGEYELVLREIAGGRALVMFRRALTHWALGGLVVEKSYLVREEEPGFRVRVVVRNESPELTEVSYWSHNCFSAGAVPTLTLATADGEQVFSGEQQPREVWAAAANVPEDQRSLLHEACSTTLASTSFALTDPSGARLEVATDPSLLQVYRWWDGTRLGRYTVEWIYQRQELASGRSWSTEFEVMWR